MLQIAITIPIYDITKKFIGMYSKVEELQTYAVDSLIK
jgi:hypothetical protein